VIVAYQVAPRRDLAMAAVLLSVPVLLLPSTLQLAVPDWNPSITSTTRCAIGSARPPSRRIAMSVLVRFVPTSLTSEKYDESLRRVRAELGFPPEGLEYHACFGSEGNLRVSEVWDSPERFQAFGERLMPLLYEIGIEPGEPEMFEIHNIVRR
jgi:hypothetical protein